MPQNLIRMPERAEFEIGTYSIKIRDYKLVTLVGLFPKIICIIRDSSNNIQTLSQFEKQGVSFEVIIECCVRELEDDVEIFADFIWGNNHLEGFWDTVAEKSWDDVLAFSESESGRTIAGQFIEKIRSCDNWEQLYTEMHISSKFRKDMEDKILKELKRCRKV